MDYQGNSKKGKEESAKSAPKENSKEISKIVTEEVVIKKKPLGRKIRDTFIAADAKSVVNYVTMDVLIPAAKNMIVDASRTAIERMMYGDRAVSRTRSSLPQSHISYNRPVQRNVDPRTRSVIETRLSSNRPSSAGASKAQKEDYILASKDDADIVLERMFDVIETHGFVTVGDLHEMVGWPSNYIDQKWGWDSLPGAEVKQVREGYLIDLPPVSPIQ